MKKKESTEDNTKRKAEWRSANREQYNAYMREYRKKHSEKMKEYDRQRREDNPEIFKERNKKRYWDNIKKNKEIAKARYWKDPLQSKLSKYKLSKDDYFTFLENQNGKCAICNIEMKIINIDHCHETGKIRGLLCTSCNTGIGKLKDNTDILKSAIKYLENQ